MYAKEIIRYRIIKNTKKVITKYIIEIERENTKSVIT